MHASEVASVESPRVDQRIASTILTRIAGDLEGSLREASEHALPPGAGLRVEAVVPRKVADFRARFDPPGESSEQRGALVSAAERLRGLPWVARCVSVPPNLYIDLELDRLTVILREELTPERRLGFIPDPKLEGRLTSLAFCSPNANKPLHLGHARNMFVGAAIGNLLELAGARVIRSCCVSDYGVHISKALAAYVRYGAGATPQSAGEKGDHFVGRFYALFCADPVLAEGPGGPQSLTVRWMQGDAEVRELTRRLTGWAEDGFGETFAGFGISFDRRFRETGEHPYIERFIEEQRARGTLREDKNGRLVVDVDTNPPQSVPLARSDGSPLYMSHMVAAILQRVEALGPDIEALLTVTGQEQVAPFTLLGELLDRFGYAKGIRLRHLTHGLVADRGRSLSSREGTSLTIDGVVEDLAADCGAEGARSALRLYMLSRPMTKRLEYSREACIEMGLGALVDATATLEATAKGARFLATRPSAFRRAADRERCDAFRSRLTSYPFTIDRAIRRLDPSFVANHVCALCRDFALLCRAGGGPERVPHELSELFSPIHQVVGHALETLGLDCHRTRMPEVTCGRFARADPVRPGLPHRLGTTYGGVSA